MDACLCCDGPLAAYQHPEDSKETKAAGLTFNASRQPQQMKLLLQQPKLDQQMVAGGYMLIRFPSQLCKCTWTSPGDVKHDLKSGQETRCNSLNKAPDRTHQLADTFVQNWKNQKSGIWILLFCR